MSCENHSKHSTPAALRGSLHVGVEPQPSGSPARIAPRASLRAPRCPPTPRGGSAPGCGAAGLAAGEHSRGGPPVSGGAGAAPRPSARRRRRAPRSASRAAQPGGEREGDGNGGGAARRRRGGWRRAGSAGSPGPGARSAVGVPRWAGGSREAAVPAGPAAAALPAPRARPAAR